MTEKHYRAVVVGGGPSGSSAACTLASNGIETCLIDKSVFPRDKLCGGLLSLRSKSVFEEVFAGDWDRVVKSTCHGAKFFYQLKYLSEVNHSSIYFTHRSEFDAYLLNIAASKGAHLVLGRGVKNIDFDGRRISLSDGSTIKYDFLVGADGVNSIVARSLFGPIDLTKIGFALEMDADKADVRDASGVPEIHFGIVRWGYGWVFPKGDRFTIGVGGFHKYNPDLKEQFSKFLDGRLGAGARSKIKGHFIPFGNFRKQAGRGNVLLCGDAAGLVDSITGEGIALAMQSGHVAGISAANFISENQKADAYEYYEPRYSEIARAIEQSNRYRLLVFPKICEWLFAKMFSFSDAQTLQRGFLDLLAGKIQYEDLSGVLGKQIRFGLEKGLNSLSGYIPSILRLRP